MRALHVHRIAGVGGSERHLLTLLPSLREHGVEPLFVGLDDPQGDVEAFYRELAIAEIPFRRLPCRRDVEPRLLPQLLRAARDLRAELVHTHLVHADVYGTAAATVLRLPLFSTKHNDDRFRLGPFRHVERVLARRSNRVLAITQALARFCVERVGLPEHKVTVVRYGLDRLPPAWGPNPPVDLPEGGRILLAVGRLVEQKGLETALAALPAIRERHPDVVLLVLGEGPLRPALVAQAERSGVRDALFLPGRAGDVAAWLKRADVFVHPARWEGFGLVLLEAMLAELPVVASAVSSIPEIVAEGETGLLVPPGNVEELARATVELLDDPERARRLGAAGRERALTDFSVERMAWRTVEVYGSG